MENIDVIRGYFESLKKNKNPKDFIQLSYTENNLVDKELLKLHASEVKGKPIILELVSETVQTTPHLRTIVEFKLNGELRRVVVVKESVPGSNPEQLYNWVDENGKPGLNPCSLKKVDTK